MRIWKRIQDRFSLALHEARAAHDQVRMGIPISMVVDDSIERAYGRGEKEVAGPHDQLEPGTD